MSAQNNTEFQIKNQDGSVKSSSVVEAKKNDQFKDLPEDLKQQLNKQIAQVTQETVSKLVDGEELQKMLDLEQPKLTKEFVDGILSGNLKSNPNFNSNVNKSQNAPPSSQPAQDHSIKSATLPKDIFDVSKIDYQVLAGQPKQQAKRMDPSTKQMHLMQQSMQVSSGNKSKFKDKMCKVVLDSQGEDVIGGAPGKMIYLSWQIKNDSKNKWPRYPILRNVTTSQRVLQYIKPEKYSQDLLVKAQLEPGQVFELHYEFKLPKNLPNGVFILKFQMIDPIIQLYNMKNENTDKAPKDEKFGEVMNVTIQVEDGNLGNLKGSFMNEMKAMPGLMSNIDYSEIDDINHEEADNDFEFDSDNYFKNLKIGDYDLGQIDELVNQGEQDLNNSVGYHSNIGDQTPRHQDIKEMLMKQEQDELLKEQERMNNIIQNSKWSMQKDE